MTISLRNLAIRTARLRSKANKPTSETGFCLREVRECYGILPLARTAYDAWKNSPTKHRTNNLMKIPRGTPIFWRDPDNPNDPGHVAIKTGIIRAMCWSTDIRRPGYFDKVPITEIHDKWGLEFLGWTEDLNGQKVYP